MIGMHNEIKLREANYLDTIKTFWQNKECPEDTVYTRKSHNFNINHTDDSIGYISGLKNI